MTHRISANSTVGIRIPDDHTLPAAGLHIVGAVRLLLHSHRESAQSLLLHSNSWRSDASCAGLYIVCAGHLLLHSHTESAQTLRLASEFLSARRFLPAGCTSWVPCACSCIHTQNQRNLYHWHPNSCRPDASCRLAVHRGCHALPPALTHRISVFTHRISAISAICASVNYPPAKIDRSLTLVTLRF